MKQRGFHRNKTSIAHFSRSLFGNLVANSDQVFWPIEIFPLQHLVLGVFSDQFTPPNVGEARHCKKRENNSGASSSAVSKSLLNYAGWGISRTV